MTCGPAEDPHRHIGRCYACAPEHRIHPGNEWPDSYRYTPEPTQEVAVRLNIPSTS